MTEKEKWDAVVQCDSSYDGQFFYAVKTTKIFCRPSCNSRTPNRGNILYFETTDEARRQGFRPCKRCRPDLLEYKPMLELVQRAKAIYDDCYDDNEKIKTKLGELHVSQSHLVRLFQKQYGYTPREYLYKHRIEKAKELLKDTDIPIVDIALQCGFNSMSAFYGNFKRNAVVSPSEYRRRGL